MVVIRRSIGLFPDSLVAPCTGFVANGDTGATLTQTSGGQRDGAFRTGRVSM